MKVSTALGLAGLLALGGTSAAVGATEAYAEEWIADAVAGAPKNDAVVADSPGTFATGSDGASVTLPAQAGESITFRSPDGILAGLSMPLEVSTYTQILDDGSARAIIAIENAAQPDSYVFELDLPDGIVPELQVDGSVSFVPSAAVAEQLAVQGVEVALDFGGLAIPWAVDADGVEVATYYTLDGTQLTQHIDLDSGSSFPVIADPEMEWKGYLRHSDVHSLRDARHA